MPVFVPLLEITRPFQEDVLIGEKDEKRIKGREKVIEKAINQ